MHSSPQGVKIASPAVCLSMIVKDEAHVIERCLRSVIPFIDCWCIVDTSSKDGTQDLIQSVMRGIPGELHERPWKDFGHNRSEAMELASPLADYLFFIDADEVLVFDQGFKKPTLIANAYMLTMVLGTHEYGRVCLVSTRLKWRSVGVLHEYLEADRAYEREQLVGVNVVALNDGGRSQGVSLVDKYRRDAEVLEKALVAEPDNARCEYFYLAQSYRDSDQFGPALGAYQRRAAMGGWEEEVWYSLLEVARLSERTGAVAPSVVECYLSAYQYRPVRAEPLVELARLHRLRGEYALAHLYAERACQIPRPDDTLFLDTGAYAWKARDEWAIACYWTGRYDDTKRACEALLSSSALPESERERITQNLKFAESALRKREASSSA